MAIVPLPQKVLKCTLEHRGPLSCCSVSVLPEPPLDKAGRPEMFPMPELRPLCPLLHSLTPNAPGDTLPKGDPFKPLHGTNLVPEMPHTHPGTPAAPKPRKRKIQALRPQLT